MGFFTVLTAMLSSLVLFSANEAKAHSICYNGKCEFHDHANNGNGKPDTQYWPNKPPNLQQQFYNRGGLPIGYPRF